MVATEKWDKIVPRTVDIRPDVIMFAALSHC